MRRIAAHYIFPISGEPIPMGVVTLNDEGIIVAIGQLQNETESTEFYNGIITAGFINVHCHLELSHLQNAYTLQNGLAEFIAQMNNVSRYQVNEEARKTAMAQTDQAMLRNGIVAVGDICNTHESFSIKKNSSIFYHSFVEAAGLNEAIADKKIQIAQQVFDEAKRLQLSASITPHAAYSMSERLFDFTIKAANDAKILSVHNQESEEENKLFLSGQGALYDLFIKNNFPPPAVIGKNSIYRLLQQIQKNTQTLFVHNVATNENDYDAATNFLPNLTWGLCPKSNLKIENKLPPIDLLYRKKARVAIGTDSLASNDELSVLSELKIIAQHFPQIPIQTLLQWATLNGARALKIDKQFGSLEVGKKPEIVWIENVDLQKLQFTNDSRSKLL